VRCVKDMLGGVDHVAAYVKSQADDAPNSALFAAGPLFFMNGPPQPRKRRARALQAPSRVQTRAKDGLRWHSRR